MLLLSPSQRVLSATIAAESQLQKGGCKSVTYAARSFDNVVYLRPSLLEHSEDEELHPSALALPYLKGVVVPLHRLRDKHAGWLENEVWTLNQYAEASAEVCATDEDRQPNIEYPNHEERSSECCRLDRA